MAELLVPKSIPQPIAGATNAIVGAGPAPAVGSPYAATRSSEVQYMHFEAPLGTFERQYGHSRIGAGCGWGMKRSASRLNGVTTKKYSVAATIRNEIALFRKSPARKSVPRMTNLSSL